MALIDPRPVPHPQSAAHDRRPGATSAPRAAPEGAARGPTILIVDDSRVSREVIKVFLIGRHARILEAADGAEALGILRDHWPDVILTDLEMPGMDGVALCEAVHAEPRLRTIPVLVLSGSATPSLSRRCQAAGALEILAKPIRPQQLLAAVDRHVLPADGGRPAHA